jgi:hypothetical protein
MSVEKGKTYRWRDILDELEAEDTAPPYALHRDGHVVGFALNRWQNPQAPDEILVGYDDDRERFAEIFITEKPSVPVLIKEKKGDDVWRCAGHFKLHRVSDENADKNQRVKPFDIPAIYKILFLTEAPTQS